MQTNEVVYESAAIAATANCELPPQQRVPQGWSAVPIAGKGEELKLRWSGTSLEQRLLHSGQPGAAARLRIAIAVEMREETRVEAYLLESGERLGLFDVRYAYVFQPFEIPLTFDQVQGALREGVGLRIIGDSSVLWVFDELSGDAERRMFSPHLMLAEAGDRMEQFRNRLLSLDSLQPFGWLEGCVLDGLYAVRQMTSADAADGVIDAHLREYMDEEGSLRYEDLHGRPADGRFSGIESTLPIAVLAQRQPDHPAVDQLLAYWEAKLLPEQGTLSQDGAITAEGAYTMGYPMAVIAAARANERLAQNAIRQMLIRRDRLTDERDLYGIVRSDGQREMRNWARSYTWYMLGMVRTWIHLRRLPLFTELPGMNELSAEIRRISGIVLARREADGLWACFLGEPETGTETSGSAGIAAALALGARHGLLSSEAFDAAKQALQALERHLTPDGILDGVCQHNCGGLQLQRGGYRVLSQMGMGLMAQLAAAVHEQ